MYIGDYKILRTICKTKNSCLYAVENCSAAGSKDELPYVLKEMKLGESGTSTLEYEKKISQDIENSLEKSVAIPAMTVFEQDGKEYAVMHMAKNGKFLSEIIEMLEEASEEEEWKAELIFKIIDAVLISLGELHKKYLHLDLHPGNIFLENFDFETMTAGFAKFIDFYSAVKINEEGKGIKKEHLSFTNGFTAPEQLNSNQVIFTASADTYAVAAITARMFLGKDFLSKTEKLDVGYSRELIYHGQNPILDILLRKFLICGLEYSEDYRFTDADKMRKTLSALMESIQAYKTSDYYGLFELAYSMLASRGEINVDGLKFDGRSFSASVAALSGSLYQREPNVEKCLFIFELLWKMKKKFLAQIWGEDLISLIKSGIACYNHVGQSRKAYALFEELEGMKQQIHVLEYLSIRNRAAVFLADSYRYAKACEMMRENVSQLEKIKDTYKKTAQNLGMEAADCHQVTDLARSYSALGQYMTFLRLWDSENLDKSGILYKTGTSESVKNTREPENDILLQGDPEAAFLKAIQEFGKQTINQNITYSHLLHYAIQRKDEKGKQIFEKYRKAYFGREGNIFEQIDETLEKWEFKYELYVLLKAIYTYYIEEVNGEFADKIYGMLRNGKLINCKEHPIELIYRYMGLILYEYNKQRGVSSVDEYVKDAFVNAVTCMEPAQIDMKQDLTIIMCISYHSMWKFNCMTGQESRNEELIELLQEHCRRSGWEELLEKLQQVQDLDQIFEYEYS